MKILVTSGGTKIPIDTVRDITNMSTGTFGTKIAEECLRMGHDVAFFRAKGSKSPMRMTIDMHENEPTSGEIAFWIEERRHWSFSYTEMEYSTFEQYERGLNLFIGAEKPDVIVLAAAVSDYTVEKPFTGKVRSNDLLTIRLTSLPKIINKVKGWAPSAKLVGFKMLVNSSNDDLISAANRSIKENGCDMVVTNDLEDIKNGKHRVHLVFPDGEPVVFETNPNDPNYLARMVAVHTLSLVDTEKSVNQIVFEN